LVRTAAQYLECSFRGVPFAVLGGGGSNGRKLAAHSYPFRDGLWVEDLGKAARSYRMIGFVVGPLAQTQRDLMVVASETAGPGLLVHPTIGIIRAVCMRFDWYERDGYQNVIDYEFEFVEQSALIGQTILTALHAAVGTAAIAMSAASSSGHAARTAEAYAEGPTIAGTAAATGYQWAQGATAAMESPAQINAAALALEGNYGRYSDNSSVAIDETATVESIIADLSNSRAVIGSAVSAVSVSLSSSTLSAAVYALINALVAAIEDPGTLIASLLPLTNCEPAITSSSAPIGSAIATAQTATAALCRQAALCGIAQACAEWQPASATQAQAMQRRVAALFDAEGLIAADAGDDATWQAMRDLCTQVTQDLLDRAARLPDVITISRNASLPSLVLGQQLYGDAMRSDDLTARANPVHPAFMPTSFEALSA